MRRVSGLKPGQVFTSSAEILHRYDLLPNHPPPDGFLFHTSRCGSTLLGRAMSQLPQSQVVFEGPPSLIEVLFGLTSGWLRCPRKSLLVVDDYDKKLIRNMVNLSTRRQSNTQYTLVKTVSWNVIFADLFHQAFPTTPSVFLYREPMEIFLSILDKRPRSWPRQGREKRRILPGHRAIRVMRNIIGPDSNDLWRRLIPSVG